MNITGWLMFPGCVGGRLEQQACLGILNVLCPTLPSRTLTRGRSGNQAVFSQIANQVSTAAAVKWSISQPGYFTCLSHRVNIQLLRESIVWATFFLFSVTGQIVKGILPCFSLGSVFAAYRQWPWMRTSTSFHASREEHKNLFIPKFVIIEN